MNTMATTEFEVITADVVKYSNPSDLTMKTQEEKIALSKAVDKEARLYVDRQMTSRILDIADEAESVHGSSYANEYLNKAKGIVSDAGSKIERRINLLASNTSVTEVEDDERVSELETQLEAQKQETKTQYINSVAQQAILDNDLKRANEVIQKLQDGDDVAKALAEGARLREQLKEATGLASQIPTLKSEADANREALANAKTMANGLKRQIQAEADKVRDAEAELTKNSGEALLSYEDKQNAKALASIEVAKKIREDYPLTTFLVQNGMSEEDINLAQTAGAKTLYDTSDVEKIADIIYTQRNQVSEGTIIDKIEAIIEDAIREVARVDVTHTYTTLRNCWRSEVSAMTDNALKD